LSYIWIKLLNRNFWIKILKLHCNKNFWLLSKEDSDQNLLKFICKKRVQGNPAFRRTGSQSRNYKCLSEKLQNSKFIESRNCSVWKQFSHCCHIFKHQHWKSCFIDFRECNFTRRLRLKVSFIWGIELHTITLMCTWLWYHYCHFIFSCGAEHQSLGLAHAS
jgi:hypothetical protein